MWSIYIALFDDPAQVKEHLRDVLRAGVEKAMWQGMPAMDDYCVMLRFEKKRRATRAAVRCARIG